MKLQVLYLGPQDMLGHVRDSLPVGSDVQIALNEDTVDQIIPTCDVVLDAFMGVRFPADRLARAANLKLFVTATTGADHVDATALSERQIPLLTLAGQRDVLRNITPGAEHSWLLLLACARRLRSAVQGVLSGEWDRNQYPGIMLRGKVIGIIGCGRIGEWMSRYATAFGLRCLGYDPFTDRWPPNIEKSDLETVLASADFVTVHVPFNEDTRGLIGQEEFKLIKHGAVLINTSRGEVLDESALLYALEEGRIAAAGLDVLTGEPDIADHPLLEYARKNDNLIITPHIGGFSPDALRYVLSFSCDRIVKGLQI